MKVCVGIKRGTIALKLINTTRATVLDGICLSLRGVEAKDGPHEDTTDSTAKGHVQREQVTEPPREGDHPLAHGDIGEDVVNEVRCGLGHAAATTGRTETSALAGEGNQEVATTSEAMKATEAMGKDSASEVTAELTLDVGRQAWGRWVRLDAGEESLEVSVQSLVEDLRGNVTGLVLVGARFPCDGHPWLWTIGTPNGHRTAGKAGQRATQGRRPSTWWRVVRKTTGRGTSGPCNSRDPVPLLVALDSWLDRCWANSGRGAGISASGLAWALGGC